MTLSEHKYLLTVLAGLQFVSFIYELKVNNYPDAFKLSTHKIAAIKVTRKNGQCPIEYYCLNNNKKAEWLMAHS